MKDDGNMKNNIISILMPVYNVENYIDEAIESILNQTYQNFELIVVDDCSTDNTYEHVEKYSRNNSKVKLFKNNENMKICKTLNRALSEAKGDYIARMDGDDISTPDRLEVLMGYLEKHKDISLVGSYLIGIDEKSEQFNYKKYPLSNKYIQMSNKYISSVSHFWLTYKSVYEALEGYRNIPYAEDYDFLLRGQLLGFKYANVDEYLYLYRLRQGNTVSANGLIQRKTVRYVQMLHKFEKKKIYKYNENDYQKYIYCTEEEKNKYANAAAILNNAVHSSNYIKKICLTVKSCLMSKYILEYIVSAIYLRIVLFKEGILK